MKYKSEDGFTITNSAGDYMGIHSACDILNDQQQKIERLEKENEQLREKLRRTENLLVQNMRAQNAK